ncbi:alpha/beta fold hydrolase [Legionella quinlivanii]|uniref:alpha/beta fold hydrolase n=1 Tax=Legionella quinlivanii TaxID=45073 RepID=UPI002243996A|nr:alpha/beta hydrolase [Legionella quinlivanii]MCW8451076.1 alpha/beta hydrolase [Legionella quinlivanii]
MKETIHFAHGNGFPSPCYHQLLTALETRYDYCYVDRIGHDVRFPVTENWHYLVDQIAESVKENCRPPVIGVGHSLGGVLSLIAAIEHPELFSAVVMIDSPLLNRFKSRMVKLAKTIGLIDKVTPAGRTRGRRQHWPDKQQLWDYLKTRALFSSFRDDCLNDYIKYGFSKDEEGYSLRFDRDIEYSIFRTIPHQFHQYEGKLKIPAFLIYGDQSDIVSQSDVSYMNKHYGIVSQKMKGTHMLPMENPELLAEQIFKLLDLKKTGDKQKQSQNA